MKVSVVIPTFKRPESLKRAITSVISQSYRDIEIIVVDDNGQNTEFQKQSSRVVSSFNNNRITYLVHDVNRGGSAARNTGWKFAKGELITFLDDDDEISPNKIQKQVDCLCAHDKTYGACYAAYHKLVSKNKIIKGTEKSEGDVYLQALMRTLYVGSGSNLLLRKEAVDEVGGYDESFSRNQDLEFMARVAEKYQFAYVSEDLLTIHYENKNKSELRTSVDEISEFYLSKFQERIDCLPILSRKKVLTVISLERARFLLQSKNIKSAIKILKSNEVGVIPIIRYILYMAHRYVSKTSYGFIY